MKTVTQNITEEEIKEQGGILYDPAKWGEDGGNGEPSLINANKLSDDIIKILEYIEKDEMIALKKEDEEEFENHLESKFPTFVLNYYALFKKIISGDDIMPLLTMLTQINKFNKGTSSYENVEKSVGNSLRSKYLSQFENKRVTKKKRK